MFDLTQLLDAGVVVAWRRRLATRPSSLEDHSPRQACSKTRLSVLGLSRCHGTHVNTQCCGSPPCGLIVDRHLSVNSGPGTREDVVLNSYCVRSAVLVVKYIAPAPCSFGPLGGPLGVLERMICRRPLAHMGDVASSICGAASIAGRVWHHLGRRVHLRLPSWIRKCLLHSEDSDRARLVDRQRRELEEM